MTDKEREACGRPHPGRIFKVLRQTEDQIERGLVPVQWPDGTIEEISVVQRVSEEEYRALVNNGPGILDGLAKRWPNAAALGTMMVSIRIICLWSMCSCNRRVCDHSCSGHNGAGREKIFI